MLLQKELTHSVIGCAMEVHSQLGPGLLESTYQHCLAHELHIRDLPFEDERPLPVVYKGTHLDCGYRLDMVVAGQVLLELKSVDCLAPIHEAQVLTYLKLSGLRIGLLINFNVVRLNEGGIRRFIV